MRTNRRSRSDEALGPQRLANAVHDALLPAVRAAQHETGRLAHAGTEANEPAGALLNSWVDTK